jgi:hypothetical protein
MAEQNNSVLGLAGSDQRSGSGGTSTKKSRSSATQVEQRFDPVTGKRVDKSDSKSLIGQVRSTASEALDNATHLANEKFDEKTSNISSGLSKVATNIRQLGNNLGNSGSNDQVSKFTSDFSSAAAEKIEQAADYFERKDLNAMYRDVERLARSNPAWFIGGAFALGFLAARFFKSSAPKQYIQAAGEPFHIPQQTRPQMGGSAARGL